MSDKKYFLRGIKFLVNSMNKNVNTHLALLLSLVTFSKYNGLDTSTNKIKLIGNKHIGTHPTAQARSTMQIDSRQNLTAGYVPNCERTAEYANALYYI